jgi:Zn finger protein HypA/HybF involved in hydrogenase expression
MSGEAAHGGVIPMHEAGLARGVARALRERGLSVGQIGLAVRGGHHDPAEFEAELRAHLAAELPHQAAALATLAIRRLASGHLCPGCGVEFDSEIVAPGCPVCGSDTVPEITTEQIEIELLEAVK